MFQMSVVWLLAQSECCITGFLCWKEQMRYSGDKGRASNHFKSWSFRNRKNSSCGPAGLPGFLHIFLPLLLAASQDEQLCTVDV